MTLKELKASLTEDQKKILQFIWKSKSLKNRNGPPIDAVHREFKSKALVVNAISNLPKNCVKESNGGIDSTYYLNLLGVFLAQENNRLEKLVIRFLHFARDWFLTHERDQQIICQDIQEDLNLSDKDTSLLGEFLLRGYLPITGGSSVTTKNNRWNIELSQHASELFDVVDFGEYLENLVMSYYQDDENNVAGVSSSDSEKSSPEDIKLDVTEEPGAETFSDGVEVELRPQRVSIPTKFENDRPASNDYLGFRPYVDAMHLFLTNKDTVPPLIVAIEGEWGTGKSSYLSQLRESIKQNFTIDSKIGSLDEVKPRLPNIGIRNYSLLKPYVFIHDIWQILKYEWNTKNRTSIDRLELPTINSREYSLLKPKGILEDISKIIQFDQYKRENADYTVFFDPWRYNEKEGIWAAFGIQLGKQLSSQCWIFKRIQAWLTLTKTRITFSGVLSSFLPVLSIFVLSLLLWYIVPGGRSFLASLFNVAESGYDKKILIYPTSISAAITLVISLAKLVNNSLPIPQSSDLKKYLRKPDYKRYSPAIDSFIDDFDNIIKAYAGDRKVFVFIEDLDRCCPSNIINLMSTINHMLIENPRVIFIIAMNLRLVAASFGLNMHDIINISENRKNSIGDNENFNNILFKKGYQYAEKFIQLPFRIPKPDKAAIEQYITSLTSQENGEQEVETDSSSITPEDVIKQAEEFRMRSDETLRRAERMIKPQTPTSRILVDTGPADSDSIKQVVSELAHYLDFNPRKIKNFINRFRLKIYIAKQLGLLEELEGVGIQEEYTLEKIAKLTVIEILLPIEWIELIKSQDSFEYRISRNSSITDFKGNTDGYISESDVLLSQIVKFGCETQNISSKWNIENIDITRLTHIVDSPANEKFSG